MKSNLLSNENNNVNNNILNFIGEKNNNLENNDDKKILNILNFLPETKNNKNNKNNNKPGLLNFINQSGGSNNNREVLLFKAEWCPHCKGFMPVWEKLIKNFSNKYDFITYDSEKNKEEISQWQVQGFPTIMVKDGKSAMEYIGPNEYNSVLNFIKNV